MAIGLYFGLNLDLGPYFVRSAGAVARLDEWAGLFQPWLHTDAVSTEISCAGSIN